VVNFIIVIFNYVKSLHFEGQSAKVIGVKGDLGRSKPLSLLEVKCFVTCQWFANHGIVM